MESAKIKVAGMVRTMARNPVARALVLSLLFHCFLFVAIDLALRMGLLEGNSLAAIMKSRPPKATMAEAAKQEFRQNQPDQQREPPLLFVDVDPNTATPAP